MPGLPPLSEEAIYCQRFPVRHAVNPQRGGRPAGPRDSYHVPL